MRGSVNAVSIPTEKGVLEASAEFNALALPPARD